eukprot:g1454.t1
MAQRLEGSLSLAPLHCYVATALYTLSVAVYNLDLGTYTNARLNAGDIGSDLRPRSGGVFFSGFLGICSVVWGTVACFMFSREISALGNAKSNAMAGLAVLLSYNLPDATFTFHSFAVLSNESDGTMPHDTSTQRDAAALGGLWQLLGAGLFLVAGLIRRQAEEGLGIFLIGFAALEIARSIFTFGNGLLFFTPAHAFNVTAITSYPGEIEWRQGLPGVTPGGLRACNALSMLIALAAMLIMLTAAMRAWGQPRTRSMAAMMYGFAMMAGQLFVEAAYFLANPNPHQNSENESGQRRSQSNTVGAFAIAGLASLVGTGACLYASAHAVLQDNVGRDLPTGLWALSVALSVMFPNTITALSAAHQANSISQFVAAKNSVPLAATNSALLSSGIFALLGSIAAIAAVFTSTMPRYMTSDDKNEPFGMTSEGQFDSNAGERLYNPPNETASVAEAAFDPMTGLPIGTGPSPNTRATSQTILAVRERESDSGAGLINKRIEVLGRGSGTVLELHKALGKSTKHVVLFDDGKREVLMLSKNPNDATSKGVKFYLL